MIGPTQIDRWGQTNLSCVGDYQKPKTAILGVRGLPGNSINHLNSFFVPSHNSRVFVSGEVDMVSGVGFKADRWPEGARRDLMDIRCVVSDLCVLDFNGPDRAVQVHSLHPGVSFEQVQDNTGFPLLKSAQLHETAHPTPEQLALIRRLDPHDYRATAIKGNPPGIRTA
jgi:glutaconate CoA-transferase subunit B